MIDHIGDLSPSPLTLEEAVALLRDYVASGSAAEVILLVVARKAPSPLVATTPNTNSGTKETPPTTGLARLGAAVFSRLPKLATFYLIGCAYQDGAKSLRAVAKEFERREMAGILPKKVPTAFSTLSKTLQELAEEVFAPYMHKRFLSLLCFPEGEGTSGVPSADGWLAWKETSELLAGLKLLPDWQAERAGEPRG